MAETDPFAKLVPPPQRTDTTIAKVRVHLPEIQQARQRGVSIAQIAQELETLGVVIGLGTLRTYLSREARRANGITQRRPNAESRAPSGDTRPRPVGDPMPPESETQSPAIPRIPATHDDLQGNFLEIVQATQRRTTAQRAIRSANEKVIRKP